MFFFALKYLYLKYECMLNEKVKHAITYLGSLTLGTYVMGDLWIDIFLPLYYKSSVIIHPIVSMIIMEIVVFVTGMIFTAVLKKIPIIKSVL